MKILRETGHYLSVPKGKSMWPMIKSKQDVVDIVPVSHTLKKYDLALYYRPSENRCVLHRILAVKDGIYIFYGDNCWEREVVPFEYVMGVAAKFYKNGNWISVKNRKYQLYVHLWCDCLPVRRGIFWFRDKIRARVKKMKNKINKTKRK